MFSRINWYKYHSKWLTNVRFNSGINLKQSNVRVFLIHITVYELYIYERHVPYGECRNHKDLFIDENDVPFST